MGASSTGPKSNRENTDGQGRVSFQDAENNNNEPNIIVNPHDLNFLAVHTLVDELNNNTTLINNNYMSVSLSPSSTTLTTTFNKLNQKQAFYQQQIQLGKEKMPEESPKKKVDVKSKKEKEKKKKKEKPKAPRPATGNGGGKGGGRGMDNQEQMMRRPKRKK